MNQHTLKNGVMTISLGIEILLMIMICTQYKGILSPFFPRTFYFDHYQPNKTRMNFVRKVYFSVMSDCM